MKDAVTRIVTNEKLTSALHWTILWAGILSLTFSVAATAASAF